MAHELPAFVDHYRETFQASFESALETRAASYLRGMPIPAALYVHGEPVEVEYHPDHLGHVHVAINEDGTAASRSRSPWPTVPA